MTEITDLNTYIIPDFKLSNFHAAITKMNRKAVKLGVEPVVVEVLANTSKLFHLRHPNLGDGS